MIVFGELHIVLKLRNRINRSNTRWIQKMIINFLFLKNIYQFSTFNQQMFRSVRQNSSFLTNFPYLGEFSNFMGISSPVQNDNFGFHS